MLGISVFGLRRFFHPIQRLFFLLPGRRGVTENHPGQLELCVWVAEPGRFLKPGFRRGFLLNGSYAMKKHPANAVLQFVVMASLLQFAKPLEGGTKPCIRPCFILGTSNAVPIDLRQLIGRVGEVLYRRFCIEFPGSLIILLYSLASVQETSEGILSIHISTICRSSKPFCRFAVILFTSQPGGI